MIQFFVIKKLVVTGQQSVDYYLFQTILPVYEAQKLEESAIIGGTTKPCLVRVQIKNGETELYVVKVFKNKYLTEANPMHGELMGNILAREFDLMTPKAAYIDIPAWLIEELRTKPQYSAYAMELRAGKYFGTQFIENKQDIHVNSAWKKKIDVEQASVIMGFDALTWHTDRRASKPNLFLKDNDIYLIDHESIFARKKMNFLDMLSSKEYVTHVSRHDRQHLFYNGLINEERKNSGVKFELFLEYLKSLNTNVLDPFIEQIEDITKTNLMLHDGDGNFDYNMIKQYLCDAKNNAGAFTLQLQQSLNNKP